jgi:hypothetical protein
MRWVHPNEVLCWGTQDFCRLAQIHLLNIRGNCDILNVNEA